MDTDSRVQRAARPGQLAQLLQLEVLHIQTMSLCQDCSTSGHAGWSRSRLALTLTHLRELAAKSEVQDTGWLMSVQVTHTALTCPSPFMVIHNLALTVKETQLVEFLPI